MAKHTVKLSTSDLNDVLWAIENHLEYMEDKLTLSNCGAVENLRRIEADLAKRLVSAWKRQK